MNKFLEKDIAQEKNRSLKMQNDLKDQSKVKSIRLKNIIKANKGFLTEIKHLQKK
jgi:hypothetical protein